MRHAWRAAFAASVVLAGTGALVATRAAELAPAATTPPPGAAANDPAAAFGSLRPWFEVNRGQAPAEADFVARTGRHSALLTGRGPVFTLVDPSGRDTGERRTVRLGLGSSTAGRPEATEPLAGTSTYLLGSDPAGWHRDVPSFGKVAYRDAWPGIDVVYRGEGTELEYDVVVRPGTDPATIDVAVDGADRLEISPEGDLVVTVGGAELRQSRPVLFQEGEGGPRVPVTGAFTLSGTNGFGFQVGSYDRTRPLVIDPVLSWSTTIGGLLGDVVTGVAVDASGSTYVSGTTSSANFPTMNAYQGVRSGDLADAFVAKLNPGGTALVWSTYIGGTAEDSGAGIAVDATGAATVVGSTSSTDFPKVNQFQTTKGASSDAFVVRFNTAGSALTYGTYLGGNGADAARGVALDAAGRAHVVGNTTSTDFPVLNAYQGTKGAGTDAFVALINAAAVGPASRVYGTYLGGAGDDQGAAIGVDPSGRPVVTGDTRSAAFPTSDGALKSSIASETCPTASNAARLCREAFVTKLDPGATGPASLVWSTFLGGTASTYHLEIGDAGFGIATDAAGDVYVTGDTSSDNFPTSGAIQPARAGDVDAFVTKLTSTGTSIVYSTYLGGSGTDGGRAIAVDGTGSAHVTGAASSTFPKLEPIAAVGGNGDAFVARLAPNGATLVHATPIGGTSNDPGAAIAVDPGGTATAGGTAFSQNFPRLNPVQPAAGGGSDGFVIRIAPGPATGPLVTDLAPRSGPASGGTPVVISGTGFSGANSVRFGDIPATSFQVESPTRILAVSPEGSDTAPVRVTGPGGTSPANPVAGFLYAEGLWSLTGPQSQRRLHPNITLLANGKVLMTGGRVAANGAALATAELYDPLTNTWSPTGSMTLPRFSHTTTLLPDGKVLAAGGFSLQVPVFNATGGITNAGPVADTTETYDPATGTWTLAGPLTLRRALHTATRVPDGRVLVAGGRTCNLPLPASCDASYFTNKAELFDPTTRTWTPTGSMTYGRHTSEAVDLTDGRVLMAGGFGVLGTADVTPIPGNMQLNLDSTEVYNPTTGTWTGAAFLNIGRARHSLIRLLDGRVLAVAGFPTGITTEVYDPATDTWTLSGQIAISRSGQCSVLLPTGDVLSHLAGASPSDLYDPATGRWRSASLTNVPHSCGSGVTRIQGLVLSSIPGGFEADPAVCGRNCGKAMLAGDSDNAVSDLYTPAPRVTEITPGRAAAEGGATVTITGVGLAEASQVRFGGVHATSFTVDSYSQVTAVVPAGAVGLSQVTVTTPGGRSKAVPFTITDGTGYLMVASDGGIFAFGDVEFSGSTGGTPLASPVVGMTRTPSGDGYWLAAADGGIFAFGDAGFFGSTGGIPLASPVVGIESTPTGDGYWLVAADGGIFAFGDAEFLGSTGGTALASPVVGMARTPSGNGYWLAAADGGVFAFGDAEFLGSVDGTPLSSPVVGIETTRTGGGYWLVASDGGIFAFGDAPFSGSTGGIPLDRPVVGMARSGSATGYWLVASDGGIFAFGGTPFYGSLGGIPLTRPVVGIAA